MFEEICANWVLENMAADAVTSDARLSKRRDEVAVECGVPITPCAGACRSLKLRRRQ